MLAGVFAAAALLYECLPREIDVKVISTGVVCDEKNQVVENYLGSKWADMIPIAGPTYHGTKTEGIGIVSTHFDLRS